MKKPEFRKHISNAITVNKKHLIQYEILLNKNHHTKNIRQLKSIFRQLIFSEILLIPMAIFCDFMMPKAMSHAFVDIIDNKIDMIKTELKFSNPDLNKYMDSAKHAIHKSDYNELHRLTHDAALELECKYTNCMLRHILESFLRSISIYKSTDFLAGSERIGFKFFCLGHLLLVRSSHKIDLMAFPLQQLGYPILSCELPFIPDFKP